MIFDTHTHFNDEHLIENIPSLISDAKNKGVSNFICVGWDIDSSFKAVEISNKYNEVYAAIGIIPNEYKTYDKNSINTLKHLYQNNKKILLIGEIGLDYHYESSEDVKKIQKKMFIDQINLANELNLPVSIHARDSYDDVLEILSKHKVKKAGIMHCFEGTLYQAKEFIKLGYKIAFGGVITYKSAENIREVFLNTDLKDIVLETDAPYLAPIPYRGKLNKQEYIYYIALFCSKLKGISLEEFENITYKNSCEILGINLNEQK